MKRFKFRLRRVLDMRVQIRDKARQELVRRNNERDHEISVLACLEEEYRRVTIEAGGMYSASEIVLFGAYGERLEVAIKNQKLVVAKAIEAAQVAQERYVEASQDAKALEMLREKKLKEYNDESLRQEGAVLDELAITRFQKFD
jgi:flagellar FliJ protein